MNFLSEYEERYKRVNKGRFHSGARNDNFCKRQFLRGPIIKFLAPIMFYKIL